MNEPDLALNRRRFLECFSASGLTLMPGALLAVAQDSPRSRPRCSPPLRASPASRSRPRSSKPSSRGSTASWSPARVRRIARRRARRHPAGLRLQPAAARQGDLTRAPAPGSRGGGRDQTPDGRGPGVPPDYPPLEADRDPAGHADGANQALSVAPEAIRPAAPVRGEPHRGSRASTGETGRRGDCRRQVSRAAPRHPVGPEGSLRGTRHEDDVGHDALSRPRHRHGRDGVHAVHQGGSDPRRQALDRSVGRDRPLVWRADAVSVGHVAGRGRIVRRSWRRNGGRARWLLNRYRHRRFGHRPVEPERDHRPAADVRPRQS